MGITTAGTNGSWDQPHNHFLETEPSVLKARGEKHPLGTEKTHLSQGSGRKSVRIKAATG